MYITPAAFLLFAEGNRHQDVADQHEIVCLPEELRVLLGQLLRQVGEVLLAESAKEERPLDDSVALDRAIPFLLRIFQTFLSSVAVTFAGILPILICRLAID